MVGGRNTRIALIVGALVLIVLLIWGVLSILKDKPDIPTIVAPPTASSTAASPAAPVESAAEEADAQPTLHGWDDESQSEGFFKEQDTPKFDLGGILPTPAPLATPVPSSGTQRAYEGIRKIPLIGDLVGGIGKVIGVIGWILGNVPIFLAILAVIGIVLKLALGLSFWLPFTIPLALIRAVFGRRSIKKTWKEEVKKGHETPNTEGGD